MTFTCRSLQLLGLVAVLSGPASATAGDIGDETIEAMRQRMADIRAENERLQAEIDELRSSTGDRWLTEQRTEEIRQIVHDVLADAETRSSMLDSGLMAGWSEHFFLADPSGRFKLQVEGQMQVRAAYNYHDAQPSFSVPTSDRHRWGFENTRTKLTLRGHVFRPELTYLVRTDVTRNEPGIIEGLFFARDMWVRYQLNDHWSVRVGQFKLPHNREELVESDYTQLVERSLVNENLNIGRSQGVEFTWADETTRLYFALSDGASDSVGRGSPFLIGTNEVNTNALSEDGTEFAVSARVEELIAGNWEQFRDMTSPIGEETGILFGLAAHYQVSESDGVPTVARDEIRWLATALDLSLEYGGWNIFLAAQHSYIDRAAIGSVQVFGAVGQVGYYLTPKWEVFARYEYGYWDVDLAVLETKDLAVATIGTNCYIDGHDVKWTTDFSWGFSEVEIGWARDIANFRPDLDGDYPQVVFRTQLQLLF